MFEGIPCVLTAPDCLGPFLAHTRHPACERTLCRHLHSVRERPHAYQCACMLSQAESNSRVRHLANLVLGVAFPQRAEHEIERKSRRKGGACVRLPVVRSRLVRHQLALTRAALLGSLPLPLLAPMCPCLCSRLTQFNFVLSSGALYYSGTFLVGKAWYC